MKLIKTIKKIAYLWHIDSIYVKAWRNGLYKLEGNELNLLIDGELEAFAIYSEDIVYQLVNDNSTIYIFKDGKSKQLLKDESVEFCSISTGDVIENKLSIYFTKKGEFIPEGMYLIGKDLKSEKAEITNVYSLQVGQYYFNKSNKEVFSYQKDHIQRFKIDIRTFGRNIKKHRDTGEVLSDEPNEIDGDLFGYEGLLYVPLKGGQLLALNAADGKKVWFLEHEISGAYHILDNFIYKKDGKQIYEIEAVSGKILRKKVFKEDKALINFFAAGPLWVFKEIIIVVDITNGKICIMDRISLQVLDFFSINQKLPYSPHAINWHENKLYVLDLENTLHIYEKD